MKQLESEVSEEQMSFVRPDETFAKDYKTEGRRSHNKLSIIQAATDRVIVEQNLQKI